MIIGLNLMGELGLIINCEDESGMERTKNSYDDIFNKF